MNIYKFFFFCANIIYINSLCSSPYLYVTFLFENFEIYIHHCRRWLKKSKAGLMILLTQKIILFLIREERSKVNSISETGKKNIHV